MNLYFLVEGRRTEAKVYPRWLSYLLPHFSRVERFDQAQDHNYFLISGEGYPALLDDHLANAVVDVNRAGVYDYLILCLDADEWTVSQRRAEVAAFVTAKQIILQRAQLKVVVQNRCIETWFLGNRRVLSRAPQSDKLRTYVAFHDVSAVDPELMGCPPGFTLHADFHEDYLKEMLWEKNVSYTKKHPRHVVDQPYLQQLLLRVKDCHNDLLSFQDLVSFCAEVYSVWPP